MMVLPDHDLVFLAYNKAGSSSIEAALAPQRSKAWEGYARLAHPLLRSELPWKHMTALQFERLFRWRPGILNAHRVAVVRNPWDRMVSVWSYQRQTIPDRHPLAVELDFTEYVRAGGSGASFMTFSDFAGDGEGGLAVDTVLRVEELDEDFADVCESHGLGRVELPRKNTTRRPAYREMYDDETKTIVAEHFASDIERFGYEF